jgi:hypothetical protein
MLNETRSAHIKRQVIEKMGTRSAKVTVAFEIARREDTIMGLERQLGKERDEIEFLNGLDFKELEEQKEKGNG